MPLSTILTAPAPLWLTRLTADGSPIRVVVEPLPNGRWDWTVWQDGCGRACRHGISAARDGAVRAAKAVAAELASCAERRKHAPPAG